MKLRIAMATLALLTLVSGCATGASDGKLARCSGNAKRPVNLYGTVLPTIPPREGVATSDPASGAPASQPAPAAPPTNLFPEPSGGAVGSAPTSETKVPAISAVTPGNARISALPVSYRSC